MIVDNWTPDFVACSYFRQRRSFDGSRGLEFKLQFVVTKRQPKG